MNTLKAESANPTLLTLNGLRAIVAWVLNATLLIFPQKSGQG
jgi:hypothetical protein